MQLRIRKREVCCGGDPPAGCGGGTLEILENPYSVSLCLSDTTTDTKTQSLSGLRLFCWLFCFDQILHLDVEFVKHVLRHDFHGRLIGSFQIDSFGHLTVTTQADSRQLIRALAQNDFKFRLIEVISGETLRGINDV